MKCDCGTLVEWDWDRNQTWDLSWTKWQWNRIFSKSFSFLPVDVNYKCCILNHLSIANARLSHQL